MSLFDVGVVGRVVHRAPPRVVSAQRYLVDHLPVASGKVKTRGKSGEMRT